MAAQEATDVPHILAHVENNAKPLRDGTALKACGQVMPIAQFLST
jgi:hypothetical protein